ncbi:MAG TPA: SCO family protein, partial [Planctomycetota bacterium]|nr:SCO family protein [Planctomycetota bacterium]
GIEYRPLDLRLALDEADQGRSGPTLERILLRCFRFNPATRRYEWGLKLYFRLGGVLLLAALAAFIARVARRAPRRPEGRARG